MKIAIHNSDAHFHARWINYCERENIPFKRVNCYANDIIDQLADCNILMWHHSQSHPKAIIAAKPILFSLQQAGKLVFPDFNTNWHFDDKLGQKYLLEALKTPLVPTYLFFEKKEAVKWAETTTFPKVFKLRGGAGSANVKLVKSLAEAKKLIKKAFGSGFENYNAWSNLKDHCRKWRLGKTNFDVVFKGLVRLLIKPAFSKVAGKEAGYAYFQDFIAGNDHDIRVVIIDEKAFAIKRMVRKNDFRASGSGHILYEKENFDEDTIKLAFEIQKKIKGQCVAMDFVNDGGEIKIIEISYGFDPGGYDACPGYWDKKLNWHEGPFDPYGWMVDLMLKNGK